MFDLVELYTTTHWQAGRGQRELAASLGIDRKTIRKYVAPAIAAGPRKRPGRSRTSPTN